MFIYYLFIFYFFLFLLLHDVYMYSIACCFAFVYLSARSHSVYTSSHLRVRVCVHVRVHVCVHFRLCVRVLLCACACARRATTMKMTNTSWKDRVRSVLRWFQPPRTAGVSISIHLSVYLSIYPAIRLLVCQSVYLFI